MTPAEKKADPRPGEAKLTAMNHRLGEQIDGLLREKAALALALRDAREKLGVYEALYGEIHTLSLTPEQAREARAKERGGG